jgi:hypothetical protein
MNGAAEFECAKYVLSYEERSDESGMQVGRAAKGITTYGWWTIYSIGIILDA